MNRIFKSITLVGVLALGMGCGGTELEEAPSQELEVAAQEAEGVESRKVEDMIGALDPAEGILHVQEGSQDLVLKELQAQPVGEGVYVSKDELTGEESRFALKLTPLPYWPTLFKRCSNGQWVLSWQKCPVLIIEDPLRRIWIRSSCGWKIQSAAAGVCVNSGSGSYRYQYLEAWRCGVGTGICTERRAATAIRYNYVYPACDTSVISSVQSTNYNYLCRHR